MQIFLHKALFQLAFVQRAKTGRMQIKGLFSRYLHEMCIQPSNQNGVSEAVTGAEYDAMHIIGMNFAG